MHKRIEAYGRTWFRERSGEARVARQDVDAHGKYQGRRALRRPTREKTRAREDDRSIVRGRLSAGPSVFGIASKGNARKGSGVRAFARKGEPPLSLFFCRGIGKFRCETKKGKDGRWKDIDDGHEETGRSASGMRLRLR